MAAKLTNPLTARIADRYGNPIATHPVLFRILAGGGSLNNSGQSQVNTTTSPSGTASVQLTLGTLAGENISHVEATSQYLGRALNGSPLIFYASASSGPPAFIFALSGNQQTGVVGSLLPDSLVVAVKDYYQNNVVTHPIVFSVTAGDGKVNGLNKITVATDTRGLARARFKLGTNAGTETNQVTAQAQELTVEKALFQATAIADVAARLTYVSGNGQSGLVQNSLVDPFTVIVKDRYDNPVQNHSVNFTVTSGGGNFSGDSPVAVTSDANGLAWAWLTLGESVGDSAHRAIASSTLKNSSSPLSGSPVRFYARGVAQQTGDIKSLEVLSGDGQNGVVDQWLENPIRVKVSNTFGIPVSGHTVQFRIARGNGRLGSSQDTLVNLTTKTNGIAEITWRLGTIAGDSTQSLQVICLNKSGLPVQGSHRYLDAAARPGDPNISRSTLTADSPIPADGVSGSKIVTTIRDLFGNPVPNQGILLVTSGPAAELKPNQGYSDHAGVMQAIASSTEAGTLTVRARVATTSQWLTEAQTIVFVQPPAAILELSGGDGQQTPVTQWFSDPFSVRVRDSQGHALEKIAVHFSLVEGSAEILESTAAQAVLDSSSPSSEMLTILTDTEGYARVRVRAGTKSGRLIIMAAQADDPGNQIRFHGQTLPGEAAELVRLAGDGQNGTVWHRLNQPLTVQVLDTFSNGVPGQLISFSTPHEGGSFMPSAQRRTDSTGTASVLWYLGTDIGQQNALAAGAGLANSPYMFKALAMANHAPQIFLPDSVVLSENERWHYQIQTTDLEGDSIQVTLTSMPEGMIADNRGGVDWQPSYAQAGRYRLTIKAADQFGAAAEAQLIVMVANVNRPPVIDAVNCQPQQQENLLLTKPGVIDFFVAASDPDDDEIIYSWYLNGAFCAYGKPTYRLQSELISSGDLQVKVVVNDRKNTASRSWSLKLVSAVWLADFHAQTDLAHSIRLTWQTQFESDNLGFYVQRALTENGLYQTVSSLIPPSMTGQYQFVDASAEAGVLYFYRLQNLNLDGTAQAHAAVQAQLPLPAAFALSANYPNPFNAQTRLTISLPKRSTLHAEIIDLLGRSVRQLHHGEAKEGYLDLMWDGRDERGMETASGVYYCRVVFGDETKYRKLVLTK